MKNKIIVFIVTFALMILATPFVFGKLMNSKFDEMIKDLQKKGYVIEQIEDKSTYLTTVRVFRVIIPGEKIDKSRSIKEAVLEVESKFKNLPVTDVRFFGKVLKIKYYDIELEKEINKLIKDKIKFLVITPNFKTYKYKVFDIKIQKGIEEIKLTGLEGVYHHPKKNFLKARSLLYKNSQKVSIEIKEFKDSYEKKENRINQNIGFNFYVTLDNNKITLLNVKIDSILYGGKKIKNVLNVNFDSFNLLNNIFVKNFDLKFVADNIDSQTLKKIQQTKDRYEREELLKELISKGMDISLDLKIKDIEAMKQKLGFLNLDAKIKFLPDPLILEKLKNNDLSSVEAALRLQTTPEIATLIMNLFPKSAFMFAFAKKENGTVSLVLKVKNGEIYINGEKITSD